MMESGTRSVDSYHTHRMHFKMKARNPSIHRAKLNTLLSCMCMVNMLPVGHIQFGEEEISIGRRWDPSPGWSADKC